MGLQTLLPGFEPGLPDSRSGVLTTTLQERRVATSPMAQSVARQAVNLQVAGSNPAGGDFAAMEEQSGAVVSAVGP